MKNTHWAPREMINGTVAACLIFRESSALSGAADPSDPTSGRVANGLEYAILLTTGCRSFSWFTQYCPPQRIQRAHEERAAAKPLDPIGCRQTVLSRAPRPIAVLDQHRCAVWSHPPGIAPR